jgi:hypothetical protein
MNGAPTPRPEARGRLARTRSGGYTTTPWPTAAAPRWRHTPSGKRHASCGGNARAYGLEADWRPGRKRRPTERERRRRQRQTRRDYGPHKMTAQRRRVTTSSPELLVQQPGPCRALPPTPPRPKPTSMGAPRAAALRSSSLKKREKKRGQSHPLMAPCDRSDYKALKAKSRSLDPRLPNTRRV